MFDVSWADPERETVGQRKNRKDQGSNRSARRSSIHSTRSSEALSFQTKPSFSNVSAAKKQILSRTRSNSKLFSPLNEDSLEPSIRNPSFSARSEESSHDLCNTNQFPVNGYFTEKPYYSDTEQCSPSDASESVFSGWTDRSGKTDSIWSMVESTTSCDRIIQPLGPRSYVTRSTEVTVSPRESVDAAEQGITFVHISAANTLPIQGSNSPTRTSSSANFDPPVPNFDQDNRAVPNPILIQKQQPNFQPASWPLNRDGQLNSWKPPEAWQCPLDEPETPEIRSLKFLDLPFQLKENRAMCTKGQEHPPTEIGYVQRSIRTMDSASQHIVLQRLKEDWIGADASVSVGLEVEKQFWMLSALRRKSASSSNPGKADSLASKPTKALSLYENYAFSSFLSVLTSATELHHLSTEPLSSEHYPNVYPLSVPSPSSRLPYATGIFTEIHAFPLPALLPASLIPHLLKECHRTLKSSGTPSPSYHESSTAIIPPEQDIIRGKLYLTIINPSPLPNTLGPRLRDWLDNHLILNLEQQFRCINPSRLFPIWLADAGLRGEGTSISSTRFFAYAPPESSHSAGRGPSGTGSRTAEIEVDQNEFNSEELKSMVGRMLWKEMWGSFVEGDEWWWDDKSVIEECERIGTCWEYTMIEAVKEV